MQEKPSSGQAATTTLRDTTSACLSTLNSPDLGDPELRILFEDCLMQSQGGPGCVGTSLSSLGFGYPGRNRPHLKPVSSADPRVELLHRVGFRLYHVLERHRDRLPHPPVPVGGRQPELGKCPLQRRCWGRLLPIAPIPLTPHIATNSSGDCRSRRESFQSRSVLPL